MFFFSSSEQKKTRQDAKNHLEICLRSFEEKSQDKYKKSMQFLSKYCQNNNQDIIEIVVDNIKSTIKDEQQLPVRKYQAMKLLRDLMKIEIKNKNKALGKYVLKKIFKRLTVLAEHNAGSNEEDKGKDIFGKVKKDQEKYSIAFLNELLWAIEEWAKTWPGVSDGMKKQFNEAYKELLTNGVNFPKQTIKAPQPQGYRGDQTNRNSQSPYNSLPKRQSMGKNEERSTSQIRSSSIEEKPVKKSSTSAINVVSGKLDDKKVKKYFNNIIPSIEQFLLIVNQMETPDDPENLSFLNDMIEQLRNVISEGDSFCTQLSEEEMKTDPMGKIVLSALNYSEGASKDLKKLMKNASQFDRFKTKYLKLGNELMQSLRKALNPSKQQITPQKPKIVQKVQTSIPKVTQVKKVEQTTSKKPAIPRVSAQNIYNSSSGSGNNWVIKGSQYNSNSHRDEGEVHEKFGSFGIGGIGEKARNDSSKQKEKSGFANKPSTQRAPQKNIDSQRQAEQDQKPKTLKEIGSNGEVTSKAQRPNNKENTFGSFKVSDENSKPQSSENDIVKKPKKTEQVRDEFNDSGFKEQQKVQLSKEQKAPHQDQPSANFFGEFDQPNPNIQPSRANRIQRRIKVNATAKQINAGQQNPFENPFNSKIGSESNNFSAFNNEKPSALGSQSQVQNQKQASVIKDPRLSKRKDSFNDPFQNSFELNKSSLSKNQRNSFDDKNPNFWEGQAEKSKKSNEDDRSQRKRAQIQNPFQTQDFTKRNQKSVNPFEDDNKSELSQKNKSSVLNFEMNKSFTKSDRQNPFENPFETTSNNLSRTNEQPTNPFEQTSKDDFKPKPIQTFESVSQQGSFKKVDIKQTKIIKNTEIDNPFETMTEHRSIDEARNQQKMNESFKFSVKGPDQNDGFDFDQFENISKAQRDSINTSSFANPKVKTEPNDFANSGVFGNKRNSIDKTISVSKEKSIHFSQFGQPGDDTNGSKQLEKKEGSRKSVHFSDFGDFNEKKTTSQNDFDGFSGFKDVEVKQKNNFEAFQVSKTSKNDFFRETQKSQQNEKPEDIKSKHSQFSGFNMNGDSKSERKDRSSVDWNDFGNFEKGRETDKLKFDDDDFKGFGSEIKLSKQSNKKGSNMNINTDRSEEDDKTQKRFYDKNELKLQFSEDNSKYQSPQFNQKYDSASMNQQSHRDIMSSLRQVEERKNEDHQSIQFEQFPPIEKKGYEWNPLGIKPERGQSRLFSCTDNQLQAKKREFEQQKLIYEGEKQLIQKAKELYNQARKVYLEKVAKIDMILKQKQSYKKILVSLKQANHNKESEIFTINEKIKEVSALKEKILEKEKLFFEKTKAHKEIEAAGTNYRPNHNKWEIFNRNLKMMRQREMQGEMNKYQSVNNYSKTGYANSRYY